MDTDSRGYSDDCSTWPGLSRLLLTQSDILDWSTVLYQGPGKVIIHPSSLYYRPFHILVSSNKDFSVLRIQSFEYRSPASVLSLGSMGSKDLAPKDSHPVSIWYLAGKVEISRMVLFLDICQTIRNGGVKRGERQYCVSRVGKPLTPEGILPLQNQFQIEFSTTCSSDSAQEVTLQMCDEESEQGCSILLERFGRHLRSRQLPFYPNCMELALLQDTFTKLHYRLICNPLVCRVPGVSYIQPDGHYEETIIATAPDLARSLLGYPNPHLCVLAYRKHKLICIQLFHTAQTQRQCHEQPSKNFAKQEIWIGADEAYPAFVRLLRIYQVLEGGGKAVEFSKRIGAYSAEKFLADGQLPIEEDRVFVLPFGQGAKLEFSFVQFFGDTVGYSHYAKQIGGIFQEILASGRPSSRFRKTRNRPSLLLDPTIQRSPSLRKPLEIRIEIPEDVDEHLGKTSTPESERWAWPMPPNNSPVHRLTTP